MADKDLTNNNASHGAHSACPVHTALVSGNGKCKTHVKGGDNTKISMPEGKCKPLPLEWWKTLIALTYAVFNLVLTTVMITVVHERVPSKESSPPLPDKFFDYIDRVKWAFVVTEVNGIVLSCIWFIQWSCHKYR